MANKRGQLNCDQDRRNVGFGTCFLNWKIILGAFLFDSPRVFTDEEIAELQATLDAAATDDIKANRMYPIHGFVAPTDNSEKVITEKFDYGAEAIVRDGNINWSFQFVDGGACLNNGGRTHNGPSHALFYDADNKIMAWHKTAGLSTIPLQYVYFAPFTLPTGSKTTGYNVMFSFLPKYINEEVDFVKAPFDCSEITGLQDIDIILNSFNQDSGVADVTLQTSCGATNIYDMFHSQLTAASFTAFDEDGNAVAISTFAGVAGNKTFNIGLNPGQLPDSGTVTLQGAVVSELVTQLIDGFEIGSVELEVVGS